MVGLSISCDGLYWAPLVQLTRVSVKENRTVDQPVDGFVTRGSTVYAYIHRRRVLL